MLQSVGAQPLLSEIHSHYRRLVDKYEEILQRSGRKSYLGTSTDDLLKLVCKECYTSEEGAPLINTGAQTDGCARATCADVTVLIDKGISSQSCREGKIFLKDRTAKCEHLKCDVKRINLP
ncbi:PREDICTED: uncharacterized protein LOC106809552 [Priapulus caudatus]|uniref:Uncharacterized protein LOC106809552 n=1 Tax=Priapulus caudatus TaxID=37621 RepID=A0ABM1E7I8_PRICU|nr:PREDICTED: uncharacterized protein LOC106809552 [Priapulus caudatus]